MQILQEKSQILICRYPAVDVVVKGYDTLEPVTMLMEAIKRGERTFDHIPNLVYKDSSSEVVDTGFTHKPMKNCNDTTMDRKILAYSSDQIIPMPRPFGGRWFDDFTVPPDMIQELVATPQPVLKI